MVIRTCARERERPWGHQRANGVSDVCPRTELTVAGDGSVCHGALKQLQLEVPYILLGASSHGCGVRCTNITHSYILGRGATTVL